jgi:hypothetical protein
VREVPRRAPGTDHATTSYHAPVPAGVGKDEASGSYLWRDVMETCTAVTRMHIDDAKSVLRRVLVRAVQYGRIERGKYTRDGGLPLSDLARSAVNSYGTLE